VPREDRGDGLRMAALPTTPILNAATATVEAAAPVRDELRLQHLHAVHALGVLHGHRGHDGQRMAAERGEGEQVGLQSRAAGRIGGGETEHERRSGRHGSAARPRRGMS
jgi:hypothetical protein